MTVEKDRLKRLRVDQVGSLLRPQSLIDAFLSRGRGEIDDAALAVAQDATIADVIARQEQAGLPILTDGEFRRLNWQVSCAEVEGWDLWQGSWRAFLANPTLVGEHEKPMSKGDDAVVSFRVPATGRLALKRNFPLTEFDFAQNLTERPVKAMLMGPDRVAQMCDIPGSAPHYADADAFLADVVAIQHRMVADLVAARCVYVQLDEPSYTGYVDPPTLERMAAAGEDPMANLDRAIAADNAVIADQGDETVFGLHICRGNRASMWHREGSYDAIAERLLTGLRYDRLLLEYDSERAGGFEPLRFVPKGDGGPVIVLGLITTKHGTVEASDDLVRRIEDAARFVPLDQLALSPQCGFASGIAGNMLDPDAQWRKLEVMMETAERVWG